MGEREEGVIQSIEAAKGNNLKVMIKPHLWIHSQFTGDVKFEADEDWMQWEESYARYILFYAKLSEKYKVDMFCIGTELKEFIKAKPEFWKELIVNVRAIYSGKIIYAANWDNYTKIPFWDDLDYIGVDAYFPLSDEKTPSLEVLNENWNIWWDKMEKVTLLNDKPLIFTEIGYRSIDYCAQKPWVSYDDLGEENQEAQFNSLNAFFESSKNKEFLKGIFLWKWHCNEHLPKQGNTKYTFQNKKAKNLVKEYYK